MNQTTSSIIQEYLPVKMEGKNILITGGTTGIGRATALLLAAQGANVMIFGRHEKELNDALDDFQRRELGSKVYGLVADVAIREDITKIFEAVDRQFNPLDILINNAALGYGGIMTGQYDDWQYILQTNLLGYMACVHQAVNRMKKRKNGHIVNIGSMSADVREKDSSVYVATKAAIQGFSEALRKEVNELGIKISLIEPGAVGTDMQPHSSEEQREKISNQEMMKAEDIAMSVLYVLSQPQRCDVVSLQIRPHLQII